MAAFDPALAIVDCHAFDALAQRIRCGCLPPGNPLIKAAAGIASGRSKMKP